MSVHQLNHILRCFMRQMAVVCCGEVKLNSFVCLQSSLMRRRRELEVMFTGSLSLGERLYSFFPFLNRTTGLLVYLIMRSTSHRVVNSSSEYEDYNCGCQDIKSSLLLLLLDIMSFSRIGRLLLYYYYYYLLLQLPIFIIKVKSTFYI